MYQYDFTYLDESTVKYVNDFSFLVENIHKLKLYTLKSWIFFTLMINKRKIFDFIT